MTDISAAAPGDPAGTTDYVRKHNPWVNWQVPTNTFIPGLDAQTASQGSLGSNYLPAVTNQPFSTFASIASTGDFDRLPTVSIVVPNEKDDDHGNSASPSGNALLNQGDIWLEENIGAYAAWAKANNSLLIVTWDEDDYASTNRVPTIFYGADIKRGQFPEADSRAFTSLINGDTEPSGPPVFNAVVGINHWSVLRTIEDLYRLPHIGQTNKVPTITDIFDRYLL